MMKILIADDDPGSCKLTEAALEGNQYETVVAGNGNDAWQLLQNDDIDIAILDWIMPGIDGIELCRRVRSMESEKYVYILILTAKAEKSNIVTGLDAGADDYLVKPFDLDELRARIGVGQRLITLERALTQANKKLETLVVADSLTGVLSRRAIFARLSEEVSRATREESQLSIIMLDIDDFKQINLHQGNAVGDLVLCEMTQRIVTIVRPYDIVGRIEGDVFLVILPGLTENDAAVVAERIRGVVASRPIVSLAGTPIYLSASLGVTAMLETYVPETLVAMVEQELKRAKQKGGNQVSAAHGEPARC